MSADDAPQVAVVISNFNYRQFVAAATESALAQRGPHTEVVVVDDGSTDGSLDVIEQYADDVVVVAQANGGQGAAINAGFACVTAAIVVFLDADDLVEPDLAERLVEAFRDPAVARVQFPLRLVDADGSDLGGTMPSEPDRLTRGDVRARLAVHPDDLVWQPTSGNAFRTAMLDRILPMPVEPYRICADYYLSNLSGLHGTVAVLDAPGGAYRIHGHNRHYAEQWSLASIRANVRRTSVTNALLVEHANDLGVRPFPTDASELRSVTALANRLVTLRLGAADPPFDSDGRMRLARRGADAARRRRDVPPWRRAAIAAWFVAMALTPRPLAGWVARPFVVVSRS